MKLTEKTQTSAHGLDDPRVVRAVEEYVSALDAGAVLDRETFLACHADIKDALAGCLDGLQFIRSARPELNEGAPSQDAATVAPLGDFRIIREVGRGGMGIVYEAEQMSLGRRVAIKVLPFAATLDPKQIQRFKNEAAAAGQLHHTNIVAVHFVGCERGVHFYAMQYIDGQSLTEVIADLRLQNAALPKKGESRAMAAQLAVTEPPQSAIRNHKSAIADTPAQARLSTQQSIRSPAYFRTSARLGIQAAEALDHAHELGIVHRDVKPGNLLVDARGNLWITDFGLAQMQGNNKLTMSGDLLGTLRYMSPEQALAKRVLVDHRTDIYSLGATLYELLTGEAVFTGDDRQDLLRQIAFEEPKAPRRQNKAIPAELEIIVLKALEKNPGDRYATAREMAEDLERFVKDEPIRARRPSLKRRLGQRCRRHKLLATATTSIVITLLLLGGATHWWQERNRAATARLVADDFRDATFWQDKERWSKVVQALERAKGHLDGSGLDDLRAELERRRAEAALVFQLEQAQLKVSGFEEPEEDQPITLGSPAEGQRDYSHADSAYREAFAAHGLDVAKLPAEEVVRRVQGSTIRTRLIAALDYWALVRDRLPKGDGGPLRAIAQLADNDSWRKKLRDPQILDHAKQLELLAKQESVLELRPNNSAAYMQLGNNQLAQQKLPDAIAFLKKAIELEPKYALAHMNLASAVALQHHVDEAEALCRKAIALVPKQPQWPARVYCSVAHALARNQRFLEAVAFYRKGIEVMETVDDRVLHDAACAAALAGRGHNNEAGNLKVEGDILATVPNKAAANYKAKQLLQPANIVINGGAVAGAIGAAGIQLIAYAGDVSGNGAIDGLDVALAIYVAQGTGTGFPAYRLLDPSIVGDVALDYSVDAGDISDLAAYTVHLPVAVIPPIPTGLTITPVGADPTLSLGQPLVGRIGNPSHVTVPVALDHSRPEGSSGIAEVILALKYDQSLLSLSPADITLGSMPGLAGWQLTSVVDQASGQIGIVLYSTTPISTDEAGSLVNIAFGGFANGEPGGVGVWSAPGLASGAGVSPPSKRTCSDVNWYRGEISRKSGGKHTTARAQTPAANAARLARG